LITRIITLLQPSEQMKLLLSVKLFTLQPSVASVSCCGRTPHMIPSHTQLSNVHDGTGGP
jgi:hypothetical protein